MAHGYEYASAIQYLTPAITEELPDFSDKTAQVGFMNELRLLDKKLPNLLDSFKGGGWTINSRSITVSGSTFLISYLLQRLVI